MNTTIAATLDELAKETGWLRRLAISLIRDPTAADDLVHDTVLAAAEHAPRDERPLRPWLARVLRNLVHLRHRRTTRAVRRERAVAELAAPPPTPDAIVSQLELHRLLAGHVLALAPALRDVVLWHYFEGLSSVEIGGRLGLSDGTVRWRLKQAVDTLRERLEERAPNRAWVAPLAGLARLPRVTPAVAATPTAGLGAGWLALAVLAVLVSLVALRVASRRGSVATTAVHAAGGMVGAREGGSTGRREAGALDGPGLAPAVAPGMVAAEPDHVAITGAILDDSDRPVAGLEVRLHCVAPFASQIPPTLARSGDDGRFSAVLERGCTPIAEALKDEPGSAQDGLYRGGVEGGPGAPIVLRHKPTPMIIFHVVDDASGAPLADARIRSRLVASWPESTVTDASGVARLRYSDAIASPLEPWFEIDAAGYVAVNLELRALGGATATAGVARTIRLVRGRALTGRVVDPDGRPAPNASVRIDDLANLQAGWIVRMADDHGAFSFAVEHTGRYRLSPFVPESGVRRDPQSAVELEVGPAGKPDIVLHVAAPRRLVGTVVDRRGQPVAGARVSAPRQALPPTVTDEHGKFSFLIGHLTSYANTAVQLSLVARSGSLASAFTTVVLGSKEPDPVTLELQPAGIAGVVVESSGAPIPGAGVQVICCGDTRPVFWTYVEADERGRFSLDVPGGTFVVHVRREPEDVFDARDDRVIAAGARDVRLVLP